MSRDDSHAALARSIERSLRTGLDAAAPASPELSWRIDQALLAEAQTGERTLAPLRLAVAAAAMLAAAWTLAARADSAAPAHPTAGIAVRVAWTAAAALLLLALRRGWYRRWLRYVAPAVDALAIGASFALLRPTVIADGGTAASWTFGELVVLCAFLSASGALRLSRSSARLGAALGVLVVLAAAWTTGVPLIPSLATAATVGLLGALGTGVTALIRRVVTDQVARVELARMYAEARQAVDAREEVLKIVSHDLRNPLSTISMSAQLMLETPLPETMRAKQLTVIQRSTDRMNRMIQDLLDVAKFEAGRLGIDERPLDVRALLAECEESLRPLAAEKQLRLEVAAADALPPARGDHGRAQQLIGNLVGNAIKFTPAGGCITLRAENVGGVVRFAVADTGQGIPAEHLPQVFGRLWQANRADRRGIGLGLAISKGIVEAHGGRIWVESRVGHGTTFYFTLGGGAEGALTLVAPPMPNETATA